MRTTVDPQSSFYMKGGVVGITRESWQLRGNSLVKVTHRISSLNLK